MLNIQLLESRIFKISIQIGGWNICRTKNLPVRPGFNFMGLPTLYMNQF